MLIRGIDPGRPFHWCDIAFGKEAVEYVDKGEWTPGEALLYRPTDERLVAIERPFGLYMELAGAALFGVTMGLLETAWLGGAFSHGLTIAGVRVVEVPCPDARRYVGVKIGGSIKKGSKREKVDQQTRRLLPGLVRGWPKVSSSGARDAAIAALYGAKMIGART